MDTATHEIELPGPDQLTLESEERSRLLELAAVVREHQARIQSQVGSARAHDLILYRRLRQIGGRPLLFSLERRDPRAPGGHSEHDDPAPAGRSRALPKPRVAA